MVSRFIDLHEDFGITSGYSDVFNGNGQSSFHALGTFQDVTLFSVVFPLTRKWVRDDSSEGYRTDSIEYYPDQNSLLRQLKFYHAVERLGSGRIVRSKKDLDGDGVKLLLALEGTDVISGQEDIHFLKDSGVRSIGLTWNNDTKFAASCHSKKDYGLTGSGEDLVQLCNELNLILDLGHASDLTIIETAELSKSPVVVSHTNPKSLLDIKRNIGDAAIEAVVKKGGIIGLTSIPATLGKTPTIDSLVNSISYVGENYGWDHVALGSDFLGTTTTIDGFSHVNDINALGTKLGGHADQVLWKNAYRVLSQILR